MNIRFSLVFQVSYLNVSTLVCIFAAVNADRKDVQP